MYQEKEVEDLLTQADELRERLEGSLQERCSGTRTWENDSDSLPFWVACLKEAILFRSIELAGTAGNLFRRNAMVSGAIIVRALLETTALLYRLNESCAEVVKKHEKGKCGDEVIEKLLSMVRKISLGSTAKQANGTGLTIEPFDPVPLINSLDTKLKAQGSIKGAYENLCQMVHPNFEGCLDTFTTWDREEGRMEFIQDYRHMQENVSRYCSTLTLVLATVEKIEDEIVGLLPKFEVAMKEYLEGRRDD